MSSLNSVVIKRNIILRSIVTERLRKELAQDLQAAADEVEERVQQLDFQTKAYITDLQRTDLQQAMAIRKQVENEKRRQQEVRDALLERKAQVEVLEDGAEVVRGTLEGTVEVAVGDNLAQALSGVEIVTKDDIIVEIRQRDILAEPEDSVVGLLEQAKGQADK